MIIIFAIFRPSEIHYIYNIYKQKYKNNENKFIANDKADNSFETKNPVPKSAVDIRYRIRRNTERIMKS